MYVVIYGLKHPNIIFKFDCSRVHISVSAGDEANSSDTVFSRYSVGSIKMTAEVEPGFQAKMR